MNLRLLCVTLLCGCTPHPPTLEQQAREGNPEAQYALAQREAVTSPAQAIEWLRRAAENDQPDAQHELAERLLFGKGMPANPEEAVRWVRRAAMNGHAAAAVKAGRLHLGEPRDLVEASAWFLRASRSAQPAVREDALSELEALRGQLSPAQLQEAELRARAITEEIGRRSK